MRATAVVFVALGALLATTTALLVGFDGWGLTSGLLGGAAAASLLTGAALAVTAPRGVRHRLVRPLPDLSLATTVLAVGLVLVVVGLVFGLFMVLIGAGIALFGAGALAREELVARRERRRLEAA